MKVQPKSEHYLQLSDEYNRMILAKNYRTGNGLMYQHCVAELLSWMERSEIDHVKEITGKQLLSYLQFLISRPKRTVKGNLSIATVNHHLFGIRLFFDHLIETGYLQEQVPVPGKLSRPNSHYELLSEDEIRDLYSHCQTAMERALLSVAYGCGLRRSEIVNLNSADLIFNRSVLIVTKGKGNKVREVAMNQMVIKDLKHYQQTERLEKADLAIEKDAFFLSCTGNRLTGDSLNKKLKHIILRTGNEELISKKISLHCLRHSIATHLTDRGMGIEPLREFLGHKGIDTTSLYMARRKRKNRFII